MRYGIRCEICDSVLDPKIDENGVKTWHCLNCLARRACQNRAEELFETAHKQSEEE